MAAGLSLGTTYWRASVPARFFASKDSDSCPVSLKLSDAETSSEPAAYCGSALTMPVRKSGRTL